MLQASSRHLASRTSLRKAAASNCAAFAPEFDAATFTLSAMAVNQACPLVGDSSTPATDGRSPLPALDAVLRNLPSFDDAAAINDAGLAVSVFNAARTEQQQQQAASVKPKGTDAKLQKELRDLRQQVAMNKVRLRMLKYQQRKKEQKSTRREREFEQLIRVAEKPWTVMRVQPETNPYILFAKERGAAAKGQSADFKQWKAEWNNMTAEKKKVYYIAAHHNKEIVVKYLNHLFSGKPGLQKKQSTLEKQIITPGKVRSVLTKSFSTECYDLAAEKKAKRQERRKAKLASKGEGGVNADLTKLSKAELWARVDPLDVSTTANALKAALLC